MTSRRFIGSALAVALFTTTAHVSAEGLKVPAVSGPWTEVAHIEQAPGETLVSFSLWQTPQGVWQIGANGSSDGSVHRWQSPSLGGADWKPLAHAEAEAGTQGWRRGMVVKGDEAAYQVVFREGKAVHGAEGADGLAFSASSSPWFAATAEPQHPMLIRTGNEWRCYYAGTSEKTYAVYARTSTDRKNWSAPKLVLTRSDVVASNKTNHRPFVVEASAGQYYLFLSQGTGKKASTTVYYSTDPLDFGLAGKHGDAYHLVTTLPLAAPQILKDKGHWYVADLTQDRRGIRLASLSWEAPPAVARVRDSGAKVRVAIFDDYGSFGKGVPKVSEQLAAVPGVTTTIVDRESVRQGVLRDFDVVIFTGGSGGKQADTLGLLGREQVRQFVASGGGYLGICAGNYLACEGFSWGVGVLDAKTKSSKWARGVGDVQVEFTTKGREILGMPEGLLPVRYANGPIFAPAGSLDIGDFEPLAYFRTELAENGAPVGQMLNSPAIVAGTYGKGRVLCSSPHPEQQTGMESFVQRAVRWLSNLSE